MNAIQVSQVGGPEVLRLVDVPIPEPKPNEALVQIKAAGVNFIDVYFREGRYPAPLPFVPGQEARALLLQSAPKSRVSGLATALLTAACSAAIVNMLPCHPIA